MENSVDGIVEKVSLEEIQKIQLPDRIDDFFTNKKNDEVNGILKNLDVVNKSQLNELEKIFEEIKDDVQNSEIKTIIASILDLAELINSEKLEELVFDSRDLPRIETLLTFAHKEYTNGEMSEEDLHLTINMFSNYLKFIILIGIYDLNLVDNVEMAVKDIIVNGFADQLQFLK